MPDETGATNGAGAVQSQPGMRYAVTVCPTSTTPSGGHAVGLNPGPHQGVRVLDMKQQQRIQSTAATRGGSSNSASVVHTPTGTYVLASPYTRAVVHSVQSVAGAYGRTLSSAAGGTSSVASKQPHEPPTVRNGSADYW